MTRTALRSPYREDLTRQLAGIEARLRGCTQAMRDLAADTPTAQTCAAMADHLALRDRLLDDYHNLLRWA